MKEDVVFYAIIVLYNPDSYKFIENIKQLLKLNIEVCVYDNSTEISVINNNRKHIEDTGSSIVFIHNSGQNKGLSFAFNDLICRVIDSDERNAIFFFDQDSEINLESILFLKEDYLNSLDRDDIGIFAGMPLRKNGKPYRIRTKNNGDISDLIEVYRVPTSYSLIPLKTIKKIGRFESDFFIDQIDNNYSLRCQQNNLKVVVDRRARFTHDIGWGDVMLFNCFLFPYGSPHRHYYQARNLILSYSRYNVSRFTLVKAVFVRTIIVLYIGVTKGDFWLRLRYLFKGIKDGLRNKGGKLNE